MFSVALVVQVRRRGRDDFCENEPRVLYLLYPIAFRLGHSTLQGNPVVVVEVVVVAWKV